MQAWVVPRVIKVSRASKYEKNVYRLCPAVGSSTYTFYFYTHRVTEISIVLDLMNTSLLLQPAFLVLSLKSEVKVSC